MGRTAATVWHVSFSIIAVGLYFLFALPRWWELTGATPHVLGTVMRIVAGVLIALAALPVVFTWLRARRPEHGTPLLALRLQVGSIVAHVLAGVLIVGAAISELWLTLDSFGRWLFGVYGAAAAIALLGIGAFYLSFVAELPPPPPKPLKPKKAKQSKRSGLLRKKGKKGAVEDSAAAPDDGDNGDDGEAESTEATAAETTAETTVDEAAESSSTGAADAATPETDLVSTGSRSKLRPLGKRKAKNRD